MVTFIELQDFLKSKMRLNHIYQPLLIKGLIEAGGTSTIRQMAMTFLAQDESQIQYYEKRDKPIEVLSKYGIITNDGVWYCFNYWRRYSGRL